MLRAIENVIIGPKEVIIVDPSIQGKGQIQKAGKYGGKRRLIYTLLFSVFFSISLPFITRVVNLKSDPSGHGFN